MSDAIGLELERREKILHESLECGHDLVEEQPCAQCRLEARIEALEKDFAYHAELCTSQQARIGALREAAKRVVITRNMLANSKAYSHSPEYFEYVNADRIAHDELAALLQETDHE